ncbi:hypothetical protein ACLMJK_004589 [Lecanora helva]
MFFTPAMTALLFSTPILSIPSPKAHDDPGDAELHKRCGAVSAFYNQTTADWNTYGLNAWLNDWWNNNAADIQSEHGFDGAYGRWALGEPSFDCRFDGTDSCNHDICGQDVLNGKGDSVRQAYYVIEAVQNLHSYFQGLRDAFEVSAIAAALSKDAWATTFYKDAEDLNESPLKHVLFTLETVVGIGAAAAGLPGAIAGGAGAVTSAIFNGAVNAALNKIGDHRDDTFQKSADLGSVLGQIVVDSWKGFTNANDELMAGKSYADTGDIRDYLKDGNFVDFHGVDETEVESALSNLLIGNAINELYRVQKIFILGGGRCGDGDGIGSGPQEATLCRDGRAWYLYYWQENDAKPSLTSHQWGWVNATPGMDQLGNGDYAGVKVQDLISSSLDSYNVAGYNYDNTTAYNRAKSALEDGWRNPAQQGPSWEGTFTIPVCDVSNAIADPNFERKEWILQPYGHDSRPNWCGPICSGDLQKTRDFIHAANMDGFKSPKHLCDNSY